jgi:type IV pilus assembly protein PilM
MKHAPGVWGIDIGQCALKALRLQVGEGGALVATAFDFIEYPKILSQPDADPDQLIREALTTFLSRNTVRGDTVAIAVPGQSGLARFVKLPPVEEKKIADIVKFEAKQQIPFNLDEVVWDYQKLGSGEVIDGLALETEIGLFAMKRDMVSKYMQHFKEVNIEVHCIQMAPLALCNFLTYDLLGKEPGKPDEGKKGCVVALDVGADSSNMVVTDGGRVIWQRPIPLGGNHFTRAISKDQKITFAKAEHLKRNAAKSGAAELKQLLLSLKPVLTDFVGEVQRSLNFFANSHRDANIEYMVGLGNAFRLPGMQRFLSDKLQLEVRKLDKMSRLTGDTVVGAPIFTENIASFGVCYGLALQGMARTRLLTNLLPPEVRMERLVRAKKPWAVAAASLLLLSLGGMALGSYLTQRTYSAPHVQQAVKSANKATDDVKAKQKLFDDAKAAANKEEVAVKSIVAGQFERENWLNLIRFISDCVPQPDGRNLTPEARAKYFDNRSAKGGISGKEAFEEYKKHRKGRPEAPMGKDAGPHDPLPLGVDDLIQFHIHAIDSRYCDDLPMFWKMATQGKDAFDVLPPGQFTKAPEGRGWVIEVAGYTFHRGREAFVRDTLLKTLAAKGIPGLDKPDPKGPPTKEGAVGPEKGTPPDIGDFNSTKTPVLGRISHLFLYRYQPRKTADSGGFEVIGRSVLDNLVTVMAPPGTEEGKGSTTGGGKGASTGAGKGTAGSGAQGGTAAGKGGKGGASDQPTKPKPTRTNWRGLGERRSGMVPPGSDGSTPTAPSEHIRTEFVILFVWREPLPTDENNLRGPEGEGELPPSMNRPRVPTGFGR